MKKNVIFWVGIKNNAHNDKYGNFEYFEYTKATWKHFCKRFDCHFVEFDTPVQTDLFEYRVNWQKAIYVFDILKEKNIEYDQIALVDSTCMYKWNAPNFFEHTDYKFTGWRDNDNLNWIYQSVEGYKHVFDNYSLDISKYINSGFIIFNEIHKDFFYAFKELYEKNKDVFIELQDKLVRKGTEQTPLNYFLQINNIDVKTDLPLPFKLTHLNRKEMFNHNWQIGNDTTPFFIKYGYNWIFNGIPKDQRSHLIKQIWESVKHNYTDYIDHVQHKESAKYTTSKKFKSDVIEFFNDHKNSTYIEFGSCQGDSLYVYSYIFKHVLGLEHDDFNINTSKKKCENFKNIDIKKYDVKTDWNDLPNADIVNLDALHDSEGVKHMLQISRSKYKNAIHIMDDYAHPDGTIKKIIDDLINTKKINILKWIGEEKGFVPANNKTFIAKEGLIFKWK